MPSFNVEPPGPSSWGKLLCSQLPPSPMAHPQPAMFCNAASKPQVVHFYPIDSGPESSSNIGSSSSSSGGSVTIPTSSLALSPTTEVPHHVLHQFASQGFEYIGKAKDATPQWLRFENARLPNPSSSSSTGETNPSNVSYRSLIPSPRPGTQKQPQKQQQKSKQERSKQQVQQEVEVFRITLPGDLYQAK